jgi:hypothetical protein
MEAWERIQEPEILYFLQTGHVRLDWEEREVVERLPPLKRGDRVVSAQYLKAVAKVVRVFRAFPDSGYQPALWEALQDLFRLCEAVWVRRGEGYYLTKQESAEE